MHSKSRPRLGPQHFHVLKNAAGIRGVLKQAEHLQNQLRPLPAAPVTNDDVERVGPLRNAPVIVFGNQILTHWQNYRALPTKETKGTNVVC